jgi:hypothetical protein
VGERRPGEGLDPAFVNDLKSSPAEGIAKSPIPSPLPKGNQGDNCRLYDLQYRCGYYPAVMKYQSRRFGNSKDHSSDDLGLKEFIGLKREL